MKNFIPDKTALPSSGKLNHLNIFSAAGVPRRTFHIAWLTFFVYFFGWFGLASLMPVIREDLHLTTPPLRLVMPLLLPFP